MCALRVDGCLTECHKGEHRRELFPPPGGGGVWELSHLEVRRNHAALYGLALWGCMLKVSCTSSFIP